MMGKVWQTELPRPVSMEKALARHYSEGGEPSGIERCVVSVWTGVSEASIASIIRVM
jgi:hypothetical protein